jgi:cell division protein FtsI (penicillin-binding protein 3)
VNHSEQPNIEAVGAWRYWVVLSVLFACAIALFSRAIQLHVFEQDFLSGQGDARSIRFERIDAHRGLISDRNGEPLAISAAVETIYANPTQTSLDADQLRRLAEALNVNRKWLARRIEANRAKHFVYIKRKVSPHEAERVKSLDLDGIYTRREYKRFYPAGEVAAHVVGFSDIDEAGREGIELSYDEWLSGHEGKRRVLKNRSGRVIKDLGMVEFAEPGKDIQLSLDMRLQYLAYRELKAAVDTHKAKSGSLVILDVDNGEVLAMVNQPSYNPNNRQNLKVSHLRNRAITDVFEPGSTMKIATLASALESGRYSLDSMLDTSPGYIRLGGRSIRDHRNYGRIDLLHVISKSSNVGTSKLALDLTGEVVWDTFYRLGLGQGTGIGFPGESIGYLPDPSSLRSVELAALSYGYGVSTTALQLAQAYMVLGNGGYKHSLSLIKRESNDGAEKVFKENVSKQLRKAMKAVVAKGGTGTRAQVPMYHVGGKTGTVHSVGAQGYKSDEYKALFAGIAPVDNPELAVVIVIDAPAGAEYYGGEVAAPVFSRVIDGAMRLLNVKPDNLAPALQAKQGSNYLKAEQG